MPGYNPRLPDNAKSVSLADEALGLQIQSTAAKRRGDMDEYRRLVKAARKKSEAAGAEQLKIVNALKLGKKVDHF